MRFLQRFTGRPVERLDQLRPTMAKAVQKHDLGPWRAQIGQAISRTWQLAGLTQKEAAALLGKDQAQIGRWESGEDRPQLDAIFAVKALQRPFVLALAALADDLVVETTVRARSEGR